MPSPTDVPSPDDTIEALVSEYVERSEEGEEGVLEQLCQRRPELASQLRAWAGAVDGLRSNLAEERVAQGERLGRFELRGLLGSGGMGSVYRAFDPTLGRELALKILTGARFRSDEERTRFEREARAASGLGHAGIATVYEVGVAEEQPYIALQLVDGPTVADLVRWSHSGGAPEEWREAAAVQRSQARDFAREVARVVADVAETLEHVHQHGIVHRDVKPSNVALTAERKPVLLDFGIARSAEDVELTRSGALIGTPHYASPEQVVGSRDIDARSDVYSLGVLLYEWLTGRRPFYAETTDALVLRIQNEDPLGVNELAPQLPADLGQVCAKAMEKRPSDRYPSAGALARDLRRFLSGEPVSARPVGLLGRLLRRARRQPVHAAAVALGILALVVFPSAFALYSQSVNRELRQQRTLAERESDRAQSSEEQARAGLLLARQAISGMLLELGRLDLARMPGAEQAARRTLEEAARYTQRLAELAEDDEGLKLDLAVSLRELAAGRLALGEAGEALAELDRAQALVGKLARGEQASKAYLELARIELVRAEHHVRRLETSSAREAYAQGLARLQEAGSRSDPEEHAGLEAMLRSGGVRMEYDLRGDVDTDALALARRAAARNEDGAERPVERMARSIIAEAGIAYVEGSLAEDRGRFREAVAHFQRAQDRWSAAFRLTRLPLDRLQELECRRRRILNDGKHDPRQALIELDELLVDCASFQDEFSGLPGSSELLARVHWARGTCLAHEPSALEAIDRAIERMRPAPDSPRSRLNLARMHNDRAHVAFRMGSWNVALRGYDDAIEQVRREPALQGFAAEDLRADLLRNRALAAQKMGRSEGIVADFEQALAIWSKLYREDPSRWPQAVRALGAEGDRLGFLSRNSGPAELLDPVDDLLEKSRELQLRFPDSAPVAWARVRAINFSARFLRYDQQLERARDLLFEAEALALEWRDSTDAERLAMLAALQNELAICLRRMDRSAEALDVYGRAATSARALVEDHPQWSQSDPILARTLHNHASALIHTSQAGQGLELIREAIDQQAEYLERFPGQAPYEPLMYQHQRVRFALLTSPGVEAESWSIEAAWDDLIQACGGRGDRLAQSAASGTLVPATGAARARVVEALLQARDAGFQGWDAWPSWSSWEDGEELLQEALGG